jgi:cytochrome c-type biogenesis protein CcmH/NrfG
LAAGAQDPLGNAVQALQPGELARAEQLLRTELRAHPYNAAAWSLLGVVLGNQKKFAEADQAYRRTLSLAPARPRNSVK